MRPLASRLWRKRTCRRLMTAQSDGDTGGARAGAWQGGRGAAAPVLFAPLPWRARDQTPRRRASRLQGPGPANTK